MLERLALMDELFERSPVRWKPMTKSQAERFCNLAGKEERRIRMGFRHAALISLFISFASCVPGWAQLHLEPIDSLDWMVIRAPNILRGEVIRYEPFDEIEDQYAVTIRITECIRGQLEGEFTFPLDPEVEGDWPKKLMNDADESIFFLTEENPDDVHEEYRRKLREGQSAASFIQRINLDKEIYVRTSEFEYFIDADSLLEKTRELADEAVMLNATASTIIFDRTDFKYVTIPLNNRTEAMAREWKNSPDKFEKRVARQIDWAFKLERNRPFEAGYWYAKLKSPGGDLRFGLRLDKDENGKPFAMIINGRETIRVNDVELGDDHLAIEFPYYDSKIEASLDRTRLTMEGTWRKRAGKESWSELAFSATMESDRKPEDDRDALNRQKRFLGKWKVKFSSSADHAVGIFGKADLKRPKFADVRPYRGTFLTTTGDYRYLAGDFYDGELELSVFDGAHAFLFRARLDGQRGLKGDFWSRDTWHETWTAVADKNAKLPDAFEQTRWTGKAKLDELKFPNLDGKMMSLADESFAGKVRIITVFGSWCPNCHDSARFLARLHQQFGDKGLSIVGLAFELTGDFERDAEQVRRYIKRHDTKYPILLAGLADKKEASKVMPILDRVRSYPTTIFLNEKNEVITIHTGFSGPANPEAYQDLRYRFETIVRDQLNR